jgi:predicted transcriptional regulator of viral defense system
MEIYPSLFAYQDLRNRYPNRLSYQSFLSRSLKNGKIKQVRKGLYALIDPSNGRIIANKYQIACHLTPSSFLSFHSALEYQGLAQQSFVSSFQVVSLTSFRSFEFEGVTYSCLLSKNALGIMDRMKEEGVRLATKERFLVDCIDDFYKAGGFEEVTNALSLLKEVDEKRLLEILVSYRKEFLFLKVGYLLETYYGGSLSPSFYQECLSHLSPKKYYLYPSLKTGKFVGKWHLIVPKDGGSLDSSF